MEDLNAFPSPGTDKNYALPQPQEPVLPAEPVEPVLPAQPEIPPLPGEQPYVPEAPAPSPATPSAIPQSVVQPPPVPPVVPNGPAQPIPRAPKKSSRVLGLVVIAVSALVIIGLAAAFYWVTTKNPAPVVENNPPEVTTTAEEQKPAVIPTTVIAFSVPEILPTDQKSGYCWVTSLAEPYRPDAWRCAVGKAIYDPCFTTGTAGIVFCHMNPTTEGAFTIKLTKPLPAAALSQTPNDAWAWFVKLPDGSICSPFTGTRPVIDGKAAFYGCRAADSMHRAYLMGDLIKSDRWTANQFILKQEGAEWNVESTGVIELDTVWQ